MKTLLPALALAALAVPAFAQQSAPANPGANPPPPPPPGMGMHHPMPGQPGMAGMHMMHDMSGTRPQPPMGQPPMGGKPGMGQPPMGTPPQGQQGAMGQPPAPQGQNDGITAQDAAPDESEGGLDTE